MTKTIRRIKNGDFNDVSNLFEIKKSVEELKWLFTNPDDPNKFNAFVAIDNNKIIGVIGYILSTYTEGNRKMQGVTPISWKLDSTYKGIAGVSLFKKVSALRDVGIAIGGTDIAQTLYPMFKYRSIVHSENYYKILNIFDYYKVLNRKTLLKKIGMFGYLLPSSFRKISVKLRHKNINLIPYDYSNFISEKEYKNILKKRITKNYIDWLIDCPYLKTFAFIVKNGDDKLGVCVLYIQKFENCYKGRIVHLPFLGFDKNLWLEVINKCLMFFKNEKCCFVSVLAKTELYRVGLSNSGFKKINKHKLPFYIKDRSHTMEHFDVGNWHLQFSEGDIAFRDL